MIFGWGGNGFGGNRNAGEQPVTEAGLCNAMNFNDLANQVGRVNDMMQTQFMQTSQGLASVGYENLRNFAQTQDTIKDGNYALSSQLANCCCTTQRGIDSVNYNGAINTAAVQQTVAEQTQKVLDTITGNRMADMQNQINQLQLSQAMCGVVRYPNTFAYNAVPGATQTVTAAAAGTVSVNIPAIVRNQCCDSTSTLTLVATSATVPATVTIDNTAVVVTKI